MSEHLSGPACRTWCWNVAGSPSGGAPSAGTPWSRTGRPGTTGSRGWSSGLDPDGFAPKERVADYFVAYAEKVGAPIRCGVEVTSVRKNAGRPGFRAQTSDGAIDARYVVAATGPFQRPVIPPLVPDDAGLVTCTRAPTATRSNCPPARVLVVGRGGIRGADRRRAPAVRPAVYLSVGPHDRPPRRYRGRDYCWWLGVLGKWESRRPRRAPSMSPSRSAGRTVAHRRLPRAGRQRHHARRPGRLVQRRDHGLRPGPG